MAYSDFTLKKVKADFQLETMEDLSLFADIEPVELSEYLTVTLARNVPLALAINTEKARSELIIINILLEVKEKLTREVSLFSGIDFTVDKERGLTGYCDYIISHSREQLYLDKPVIAIVEAKNENIIAGLGQCIAEMVAVQLFNQNRFMPIYGAVTSGDEWKFIKLVEQRAYIDRQTYYMSDIKQVIGILVKMVEQKA